MCTSWAVLSFTMIVMDLHGYLILNRNTKLRRAAVEELATFRLSDTVGDAVARYVKAIGRENARAMRFDDNQSLALFGAWEHFAEFSPRRAPALDHDRRDVDWEVDSKRSQHYIGFLEGKLGCRVPNWFQIMVERGFCYDSTVYFNTEECVSNFKTHEHVKYGLTTLKAPIGLVSQSKDGLFTLTGKSAVKSIGVKPELIGEAVAIDACWTDRHLFLLKYGELPFGCTVKCYELPTQKHLWTANSVGTGLMRRVLGLSGIHQQVASITVGNGTVVVFGSDGRSHYIDVFDSTNGKSTARFSSNYWYIPHLPLERTKPGRR